MVGLIAESRIFTAPVSGARVDGVPFGHPGIRHGRAGDRRSEPVRESVAESALRRSGVVVAIPTAVLTSGLSTGSGRRLRPRGRERLHEEDGIEGAAWIGSEVLLLRVSIGVVRATVGRSMESSAGSTEE